MSLYTFFGCLFTAYGPLLSIFFLYIARDAQLVLLMVCSAFFWLIAMLLSSVIWFAAKPIQSLNSVAILYSIIIQELFRWGLFKLINRAERGLMIVSKNPKSLFNRSVFAFVSGYGFGLTSALITYISTLVQSIDPGVMMCPSCPQASLFFISALTTSLASLQHILWMMLAFEAYHNLPSTIGIIQGIWVIVSHLGVSYAYCFQDFDEFYGISVSWLCLRDYYTAGCVSDIYVFGDIESEKTLWCSHVLSKFSIDSIP